MFNIYHIYSSVQHYNCALLIVGNLNVIITFVSVTVQMFVFLLFNNTFTHKWRCVFDARVYSKMMKQT